MRRAWILVAGVLALAVIAAFALVGISPDGGHAWIDSIKTAMSSAVDKITPTGGHAWID